MRRKRDYRLAPQRRHPARGLPCSKSAVKETHAANAECSPATLNGQYIFSGRGFIEPLAPTVQRVHSGIFVFDGAANLSGRETSSRGGNVARGQALKGSYTLNADCTGTITMDSLARLNLQTHWDIFVASRSDLERPVWPTSALGVKPGNTRCEQMFSAVLPIADIRRARWHVRSVATCDIDARPTDRYWRKAAVRKPSTSAKCQHATPRLLGHLQTFLVG